MNWRGEGHAIFDLEVAKDRFSVPNVYKSAFDSISLDAQSAQQYTNIRKVLGEVTAKHVLQGILRATFLIELVKRPKIETTKFEVRWATRLGADDPRYATYSECLAIFDQVIADLEKAISDPANCELLRLFAVHKMVAYEIPLDYRERLTDRPMHRTENIAWFFDDLSRKVVRLRAYLRDREANPYWQVFGETYDKIGVKTYLTDRVLTGDHKTNREKRWETHPGSVHFALRKDCLGVEYGLINQLCHFAGVPQDLQQALTAQGLLTPLEQRVARCPITMDELSFAEFEEGVYAPEHGKSKFQVGHLNPLKAINDNPLVGHTAQNISWISADGNRIQGSLSVPETRALIRHIYANYQQFEVE